MPSKLIFDGRNMYNPHRMAQKGFTYYCVGRPTLLPVQEEVAV